MKEYQFFIRHLFFTHNHTIEALNIEDAMEIIRSRYNVTDENQKYNELLELATDTEQNLVWVRNKIYLYEKEGYISYREREELLGMLESRRNV